MIAEADLIISSQSHSQASLGMRQILRISIEQCKANWGICICDSWAHQVCSYHEATYSVLREGCKGWWSYCIAENFHKLLACVMPKDATPQNFAEKTFANSHKPEKSATVFSLKSFPLYGRSVLGMLVAQGRGVLRVWSHYRFEGYQQFNNQPP